MQRKGYNTINTMPYNTYKYTLQYKEQDTTQNKLKYNTTHTIPTTQYLQDNARQNAIQYIKYNAIKNTTKYIPHNI